MRERGRKSKGDGVRILAPTASLSSEDAGLRGTEAWSGLNYLPFCLGPNPPASLARRFLPLSHSEILALRAVLPRRLTSSGAPPGTPDDPRPSDLRFPPSRLSVNSFSPTETGARQWQGAYLSCIIVCMRTTLDLDEELVRKALSETGARTKTEVVEMGLRTLLEREARKRLKALYGSDLKVDKVRRRR